MHSRISGCSIALTDLRPLAIDLATLLRPGASAMLCLMGSCCAWEIAWYLGQGKPRKAFRRLQHAGVTARLTDEATVHVHYPSVRSIARTFLPEFRLKSVKGIGVAVPPSYVEPWAARFPRWFELSVRADRFSAGALSRNSCFGRSHLVGALSVRKYE